MSQRDEPVDLAMLYNQLWDIKQDTIHSFIPSVSKWLKTKSKVLNVPHSYLAIPLIVAVSHLLRQSEVRILDGEHSQPCIVYGLVAGKIGTNKSGAMEVVRRLIDKNYTRISIR